MLHTLIGEGKKEAEYEGEKKHCISVAAMLLARTHFEIASIQLNTCYSEFSLATSVYVSPFHLLSLIFLLKHLEDSQSVNLTKYRFIPLRPNAQLFRLKFLGGPQDPRGNTSVVPIRQQEATVRIGVPIVLKNIKCL
jgi:hypothetical protein